MYTATFEIDFWADYTWGYDVSATATDVAGNVMAMQTGGGLQYVLGQIAAGILAFFAGAEMAGGVLGFFMGFAAGLFEDLTIFLHLEEMWDAIQQLPKIIGMILGDPAILLTMVEEMVNGILAKDNLVNPYGPSTMTAADFATNLVKFFWRIFDPSVQLPTFTTADLFNLAFAVSHLVGYFLQQFVIGTGLTKVLGHIKKAGTAVDGIREVGKAVETGVDAVRTTQKQTSKIARIVGKGFGKPAAESAMELVGKPGLKVGDDASAGIVRFVSDLGPSKADAILQQLVKRGDDVVDDIFSKLGKAPKELQPKISKLIKRTTSSSEKVRKGAEAELDFFRNNFNNLNDVALYEKLADGRIVKPDFRLKDGTIAEIKSWSDDALNSPYLRQELRQQVTKYHQLGLDKGWGGNVQLWLKGDFSPTYLADLKANLGGYSWLELKAF